VNCFFSSSECQARRVGLSELHALADAYQFKATQALVLITPTPFEFWIAALDQVRRNPFGAMRIGIEIIWLRKLACNGPMEHWAALSRFLWICEELWNIECRELALTHVKAS
jgi:hypothetical protein